MQWVSVSLSSLTKITIGLAKQFRAISKHSIDWREEKKSRRFKVSKGKEIYVRCVRCREWVPTSISFKDKKSFDLDTLIKNKPPCPRCGEMTSYHEKNLCIRDESGEMVCIMM
jgi:predicted nucleic-acid-binding Zn-ribbon protein